MEKSKKQESAVELLRKILELEERHAHLKQEISKRTLSGNRPKPDHQTASTHRAGAGVLTPGSSSLCPVVRGSHDGFSEPFAMKLTETQYWNVMQSMDQAIHIFDLSGRIFFWSQTAENLYGFTPDEAYGKTPTELLVEDPKDAVLADYLLMRTVKGESWSGEFPIRKKNGKIVMVIATNTPYRDENRSLIGGICVTTAVRQYQVMKPGRSPTDIVSARDGFDSRQPSHPSISAKISNFASRVKLKMKTTEKYTDHEHVHDLSNVASSDHSEDALESTLTPRGHIAPSPFSVFHSTRTDEHLSIDSSDETNENKLGIRKILSSKAEAWMGKTKIVWPWKEREDESFDARIGRFGWHRLDLNQEHEQASGLWLSSIHVSSNSSSSSSNNTIKSNANAIIKVEKETDYEILWEDLIIREQIGQGNRNLMTKVQTRRQSICEKTRSRLIIYDYTSLGSCGTVYHGLWYGSDIAVKLFEHQQYSDDVILSFKQEVSMMKRLRHPNILLFMGAVTSPPHLCIVTEFLPRGSLFRILQRNTTRLDWKKRLHMATDIARGMNYLHRCNPPIVHRDLKSSNLLVDKNWTVKVGDFGLSRVKHETRLKTKTGKGTPQWMAPEILRNQQANETSDIYSYGVVLWEITTEKIPWDDLNAMQVIAAVGFMNRQLEIPKDVDPMWASLIQSCWRSEPESRPTFQEILYKLKDLQKKFAVERRK